MKRAGLSTLTSIILLVSISIVVCIAFYLVWSKTFTHTLSTTSRQNTISGIVTYSIKTGPGYILLWASASFPITIREFVLFNPQGKTVCIGRLPYAQVIRRNLTLVKIPLLLANCTGNPSKYPYLTLGLITDSSTIIVGDVYNTSRLFNAFTLGYLIDSNTTGKAQISSGTLSQAVSNLQVYTTDPLAYFVLLFNRTILWCYNNTGMGSACGRSLAIVFTNTSVVYMENPVVKRWLISRDVPVIVMVNPTYGTKPWTITIIDTQGNPYSLTLPKLVDDSSKVVLDYVVMIEDMWPWNPSDMSMWLNYQDTILRVTVFVNGTVRVQDLADSGAYYHAIFLRARPRYLRVLPYEAELFYDYVLKYLSGAAPGYYYSPLGLTFVKPFYFTNNVIYAVKLTVESTPTSPVYVYFS